MLKFLFVSYFQAFCSCRPITYFLVDVTVEEECISHEAITEFIYKFRVQALKKIMRTKGGANIHKLALVIDVRT